MRLEYAIKEGMLIISLIQDDDQGKIELSSIYIPITDLVTELDRVKMEEIDNMN